MVWTVLKPCKSGFYWYATSASKLQVVEVDMKYRDVLFTGGECPEKIDNLSGFWLGPLQPEIPLPAYEGDCKCHR